MAQQVIRIMCPNLRCRSILGVPPEARGRMVRCRHCGTNIKIPTKTEGAAAPPPDADAGDPKKSPKAA